MKQIIAIKLCRLLNFFGSRYPVVGISKNGYSIDRYVIGKYRKEEGITYLKYENKEAINYD
jgi:hypothetical protein